MTTTLTRDETQRLGKLRARLDSEFEDLKLAGLEERAAKVRDERDQVTAKLDAAKEAHQAEQERQWQEKRRQEEAREAREQAEEQGQREAVRFLENLFASGRSVEVGVVYSAAEEEGIERHHLLHAAGAMGLRSMGWARSGLATIVDRSKGHYWGRPGGAGMIDAGPPSLPPAA